MICPLLAGCEKEVDLEHYTKYCANIKEDKYKECPYYKELSLVKRKPLEWSKIAFTR